MRVDADQRMAIAPLIEPPSFQRLQSNG